VPNPRLLITAVVVEGRSQAEVARSYGVSPAWLCELVARYRAEGQAAFQPRSRRPASSPTATPPTTVDLILRLRKQLEEAGLDAGAETIVWHLQHHHGLTISRSTVWRQLRTAGLITPQPKKRPKTSYIRFQADQPNELWQTDFTHWRLADDTDVEILTFLDDHSRLALHLSCHRPVTGAVVLTCFRTAIADHGPPAAVLSDNGMVYTVRFATGRGGRTAFEAELARLGIEQRNSRPNHPTTCGKVERFQKTLKRWLTKQPRASDLTTLQAQLDGFRQTYNQHRPHRSLGRITPDAAYQRRPKAGPGTLTPRHDRVREDVIDRDGKLTLRRNGRLHHIGIGRDHARTRVLMLIDDLHVRIIDKTTGELIRELVINPDRDYQPTGKDRYAKWRDQGFADS
jgi:transposase InsO family protein